MNTQTETAKKNALATVQGEQITMPDDIGPVMKSVGVNGSKALMTAKDFLCTSHGITPAQAKGQKLGVIKEMVGKDKAKATLADYQRRKVAFHIWSAKVAVLAAADPTLRKTLRVVMGKGGALLGFDAKARFVSQADSGVAAENALLKQQLADMQAQLKRLTAGAAKAVADVIEEVADSTPATA